MIAMGINTQLINIIKSFLNQRKFYVKVDNSRSSTKPVCAGVPQESCLSPNLFSIYVNDMPLEKCAKMALFADDTLFYVTGSNNKTAALGLQKQLDRVQPWFVQWKITINAEKTSTIRIQMGDNLVEWTSYIKYLGVHIDRKLNFSKHVKTIANKAKGIRHALFPLINLKSPLPLRIKLCIYKTYILPIVTYASPAWFSNLSISNIKKLETLQSKTLRMITKLPQFVNNQTVINSTKISSIYDRNQLLTENFKKKIQNSSINHISNISKRPSISSHFRKKNRPINF